MSLRIQLDKAGGQILVRVHGAEAPRADRVPARPANHGLGDSRKLIVPVIKPPAGPSATDWEGGPYLSIDQWLAAPREGAGLLVQPGDDVFALQGRLDGLALVAVDFPRIGDGRGYSQAVLLRTRLGYAGPLRAVGAVTVDQLSALARVGFTDFALRADQGAAAARRALDAFTHSYQGALVAGADALRATARFDALVLRLERTLGALVERHGAVAFATSLSAEDMVITDALARARLPIAVFTLDTGRLNPETRALIDETRARYDLEIAVVRPDDQAVADYVARYGLNGFYDGLAQRKLCCAIRKVEPLNRALAGARAWITGQRRDQAITRAALSEVETDPAHGLIKYNPLAAWRWADVLTYAERFSIPMNALYARGYVSIGCEPCTKAIRPGQDPRDGRWWWENQDTKECGLHTIASTAR